MIDEAFVRRKLAENVNEAASKLSADAVLLEQGIDSLDMFNVVMACEKESGMAVSDDDFEKLSTIERIVEHFAA
jgi:acyl carrier protein